MKFVNLLAKMFYWNSLFYNKINLVSIRSLKNKIYNPKYFCIYFYKQENELQYLLPNVTTIYYYDFVRIKKLFNAKQHIILLNNKHEIIDIYRELNNNDFKVSILNWSKYKNINDIFKKILNKK